MKVKELIEQRLLDPRFRKAWYELAPRFDIANAMIRFRAKKDRMTQAQLAELTGISQRSISALEHSIATPNIRTLIKLAEGMGAVLRIRFDFDDPQPFADDEEAD